MERGKANYLVFFKVLHLHEEWLMTPKIKTIPFGEYRFIKDASVIAGSGLIHKNQVTYHFGDYDLKLELLNEEISASTTGQYSGDDSHIDAPIIPLTYYVDASIC